MQVYELQSVAEAAICIEVGVDNIGSVLLDEAHAFDADVRAAQREIRAAGRTACLIPLFSDVELICRAIDFHDPHIVHFCESLADENGLRSNLAVCLRLQAEIRRRCPQIKLMRAIPVAQVGSGHLVPSVQVAAHFAPISDFFIADTYLVKQGGDAAQPVGGFVGITGKQCCWDTVREVVQAHAVPLVLAGGLDAENVAAGMRATGAWGADTCTRTNKLAADGTRVRFAKDRALVRQFVQSCRAIGG